MNIENILREVPLFKLLPDNAFARLVQTGEILSYRVDQVVCSEGEETDAMYIILDGQVRIFKQGETDQEVDITSMKSGEFFGEMALLGSQIRSATVACVTPCLLFMLEKTAFMPLLFDPETQSISMSVFESLVKRMGALTEKYFAEELTQRTLQAKMEAERHRMMTQMVAGVAHELNTPLGTVHLAVNMIEKRVHSNQLASPLQNSPEAQAILADIMEAADLAQRNIRRAHKLVENFKKISVNQLTMVHEEVDIRSLVVDILDLFKLNARRAHLNVTLIDDMPNDQATWSGYPGQLTQVLTNLLFNVERYAYQQHEQGQVKVRLGIGEKGNFVLLVQDFGKGIAAENLPRVFDPFFTTGRVQGGTGLGLSIVHNIVTTALQGSIQIESEATVGTTVTVTFPRFVPPLSQEL